MEATLWLARHARPLIADGICYGQLDVAADTAATLAAARALAAALPLGINVSVSPLQRCRQLADSLQALRSDLRFGCDARLQEMHFGAWENTPWSGIPKEALDAWTADFGDHRFGGVESANEVLARVAAAWSEEPGPRLWITHAGVIRAVQLLAQGIVKVQRADQWPLNAPAFGQWLCL